MAISGISGSSSSAASDPQVRALKAKIEDWTDCPTTDASTKKSIVGRLQVQLDGLTSAIQSKDDSKQSEAAVVAAATGLGNRIDIRA
jgi:ubiquitin